MLADLPFWTDGSPRFANDKANEKLSCGFDTAEAEALQRIEVEVVQVVLASCKHHFIVNSTAHSCVEMLVEVILAVQVAPPLAVALLFQEGIFTPPAPRC